MCKNSLPVVANSLEKALSSFSSFIKQRCCTNGKRFIPVIICHNGAVFDVPILLRNDGRSYDEELQSLNVHFGDSLPLIKSLIQRKHTSLQLPNGEKRRANIGSIYRCLFREDFNARDALQEDVKALRKILVSQEFGIDIEAIVNGSQIMSVCDARSDLDSLDKKHDILQTFVGNLFCPNSAESAISKTMADKSAGSGLSYQNLSSVHQTFGDAGIVGILSGPQNCQRQPQCSRSDDKAPRITKNKRILKNIIIYFQSKSAEI